MKPTQLIPTLLASLIAISLTACSSGGGSAMQHKPAPQPVPPAKQDVTDDKKAEKKEEKKEDEEKVYYPPLVIENKFQDSQLKDIKLEGAYFGGYVYQPNINNNQDAAFYGNGPLDIKKGGKHALLTSVNFDQNFLKEQNPNPETVKKLDVTDNGEVVGSFQFVNMNYASILTFMSEHPSNKDDPSYNKHIPLVYYTAKPSSAADLARQQGTANYNGKVIGYKGGVYGDTPKEQAHTDINFLVDFGAKEISGEIKSRFDDVGGRNLYKWLDPNAPEEAEEDVYRAEFSDRKTRPLILEKTKISTENGVVSFGPPEGETINAGVKLNDGSYLGITSYSGIFAGPELDEIVGQIGNSDEKLMFGATKQK